MRNIEAEIDYQVRGKICEYLPHDLVKGKYLGHKVVNIDYDPEITCDNIIDCRADLEVSVELNGRVELVLYYSKLDVEVINENLYTKYKCSYPR